MKKNKVVKFVVIILLLLIILMQNIKAFAEPIPINVLELAETFQEIANNLENFKYSIENDIITINYNGKSYEMYYYLGEKPTFIVETEFKKGMSYEEFKEKDLKVTITLLYAYMAVAKIQGVNFDIAANNFIMTLIENLKKEEMYFIIDDKYMTENDKVKKSDSDEKVIYESEFSEKIIEMLDELYYEDAKAEDSGSGNTFILNKQILKTSENTRTLFSVLEIDLEGNFEKVIESVNEKYINLQNALEKLIEEFQRDIIKDNPGLVAADIRQNVVTMANELLRENEKKAFEKKVYYANGVRYPNAGLESNICVPIIKIAIGILVIFLIVMIRRVKKYEND